MKSTVEPKKKKKVKIWYKIIIKKVLQKNETHSKF